ncbi:MAG: hypothetical protein NT038_11125, partial [Euryarchaeota archaeon]|nr:hypothetical protein [Euryarchaeota archaeon]
MTITWYSNSSGFWVAFGTNSSVANGTYHQTNSNFSGVGATYYWNVSVYDGKDVNNSGIYYFATSVNPPTVSTNVSTGVLNINATLWGYLSSNGGAAATCGFWYDTISGGTSNNQSIGTVSSGSTFSYNASLLAGRLYYFKVWASNSAGF